MLFCHREFQHGDLCSLTHAVVNAHVYQDKYVTILNIKALSLTMYTGDARKENQNGYHFKKIGPKDLCSLALKRLFRGR